MDQKQEKLCRKLYNSLNEKTFRESISAMGLDPDSCIEIMKSQINSSGDNGITVGGDVHGGIHINKTDKDETDHETLRRTYLSRVFRDTGHLTLDGIDPTIASDASESGMKLGAVYTALLTKQSRQDEFGKAGMITGAEDRGDKERISALEMLDTHQHLVLLGDPGSGKSTFVNFVAWCLAGEALGHKDANLKLLTAPLPVEKSDDDKKQEKNQPWSHGALLPIRIILRDFAAASFSNEKEGADLDLWNFIGKDLKNGALENFIPVLRQELCKKGALLLLDGLDEVSDADRQRVQIKLMVEEFINVFQKCKVLVTSRTYAYQEQDWRIPIMIETELSPFSPGQIERFIDSWYDNVAVLRGMDKDNACGRAQLLKQAVEKNRRLSELARRPLLLTLMASLHAWRGGNLPEKREKLYADTLDLLLEWWEGRKVRRNGAGAELAKEPSLSEWLRTDRDQVRELLSSLAYEAHSRQKDLKGTADIAESDLIDGLLSLSDDPDIKLRQLVKYLSQRAGLLVPRGVGVYTFPHRTFQEYLSACYLTDNEYPDLISELARKDPNRWREVALLAGAKAAGGTATSIWLLAEALCHLDDPESEEADIADTWGALIAGQAIVESAGLRKLNKPNQKKLDRIKKWLVYILSGDDLPAVERVLAGNIVARLGDPRFDPDNWYLPKGEDFGFVEIPARPFKMGTERKDIPKLIESFGDYPLIEDYPNALKNFQDIGKSPVYRYEFETPRHEVVLPEYYIARYPVTKAQFRAFIKDSGYEMDGDWEKYGLDNHPVVMVNLYDADAYCRWLSEKLKEYGWTVRLPTEAEWEKAVIGGTNTIFPWGDKPEPEKMNFDQTGIGDTSSVGCFSEGASSSGVLDSIGNVLEWTMSLWGEDLWTPEFRYPYKTNDGSEDTSSGSIRVMRGGSWDFSSGDCRTAFRFRCRPGYRLPYQGFRVVCLPGQQPIEPGCK
ncbi:SUMF1/EgtB/PvdO family nonheme iron enzyme [Desulfobacterales bacterium HSG16]|nr:SUMF1/EgtB/PvdO family nonheme iron enzyme [Desulfobacterales bacterium HSG16]